MVSESQLGFKFISDSKNEPRSDSKKLNLFSKLKDMDTSNITYFLVSLIDSPVPVESWSKIKLEILGEEGIVYYDKSKLLKFANVLKEEFGL